MKIFEAEIAQKVIDFLKKNIENIFELERVNKIIYSFSGICDFFEDDNDLLSFKRAVADTNTLLGTSDRMEYGDFQTNINLANQIILYLLSKDTCPKIVVEPTCGKGNFVIAALKHLPGVEKIFGVEIYRPYVWEIKFNILLFFLDNPTGIKPEIHISHCSVFDFNFKQIRKHCLNKEVLVIGNPPWVTNSKLGTLNSVNLPKKSNFKKHSGLDAITGKGNFDIAEFITLLMLDDFHDIDGSLLFLVKSSVIKNIIHDQNKNQYQITDIEKLVIDSKKEFNASVEAALLYCKLKSPPNSYSTEFDFYNSKMPILKFGWLAGKFVSNINTYIHNQEIDGQCPFIWRQGLKHDCSQIMELEKIDGHYINGLNEEISLEDDLVYGFLKSSDLKNRVISQTRKFTIVTQKRVGQETQSIKYEFPKTYQYLIDNLSSFQARKSIIYNNKPMFSIFGIGEYSFKKYKVGISGLYKTFHFTLILPQDNKPVMLDDTCYLIGFEKIEFAVYSLILLNSQKATDFFKSITFNDAKRTFTKDILMRLDLLKIATTIDQGNLISALTKINEKYGQNLTLNLWEDFLAEMTPISNKQVVIFA